MSIISKLAPNYIGIQCLLGDLFEFEYGKSLTLKKRKENGIFPVMGSNGIIGYHDQYLIKGPAIIIGRKGAVGEVTFIDQDFWPIDTTYYVKVSDLIDMKFSFYLLKSLILNRLDKSTAIPGLSRNDAYVLSVFLPPLPEQRAIVAKIEQLFSELDSGVENLKKAQAQLKVYRQAVLKWAFEGKLTEVWRKQQKDLPTAETLLAQIKAEREDQAKKSGKPLKPITPLSNEELAELPKLPQGWVWVRNEEYLFEVKDGTHNTPKYQKNGIPFITQKNIRGNGLDFSNIQFISKEDHLKFYQRSDVSIGDIIISMIGHNRGMCTLVDTEREFSIKNVGLFKFFKSLQLNKFSLYYYKSTFGLNIILSKSKGGAQPFIGLTELRNWAVPICTFPEQQKIVQEIEDRLSVCDKLEETIAQSLQQAESLRQSILKKAFSGQLLTQTELEETRNAPDWEPAEKLLERIKAQKETQQTGKIS